MADQQTTEVMVEGSKVLGSGGLGAGLLLLAQRLLRKEEVSDEREAKALEAVAAELKLITAGLGDVKQTLGILTERLSGVLATQEKHETKIDSLQREVAELAGAWKLLREQVGK